MNSEQRQEEIASVELFKHADLKIEQTRKEVSELLQKDLALTMKVDRLTDRIDHGVAITGQKTLEKVTDLATQIGKFGVIIEKMESVVNMHDQKIKSIDTGVFWLAFVGVLGGIVSIIFLVMKSV